MQHNINHKLRLQAPRWAERDRDWDWDCIQTGVQSAALGEIHQLIQLTWDRLIK